MNRNRSDSVRGDCADEEFALGEVREGWVAKDEERTLALLRKVLGVTNSHVRTTLWAQGAKRRGQAMQLARKNHSLTTCNTSTPHHRPSYHVSRPPEAASTRLYDA